MSSNGKWGGAREGAGRKHKADEIALIEKLSPLDELFFSKMEEAMDGGDPAILKLFAAYRWGQPRQTVDTSLSVDMGVIWNEFKVYEVNDQTN
jgi:hypothetical protein